MQPSDQRLPVCVREGNGAPEARRRDSRGASRLLNASCPKPDYFGGSPAGGVAPGGVAPGAAPSAGGAGAAASCLMLSVITPIVHPLAESRIASSAFTARPYLVLSSAWKKMTGGPCVASFAFTSR